MGDADAMRNAEFAAGDTRQKKNTAKEYVHFYLILFDMMGGGGGGVDYNRQRKILSTGDIYVLFKMWK